MLKIDQFAYSNHLRSLHPLEKTVFALLTMGICLAANSVITSLVIILLMAGGVILAARIPAHFYLKLLMIPVSFLLIGTVTVIITVTRDGSGFLWYLNLAGFKLGLKSGNIVTGVNLFLKSFASITCLYFLALTTPMTEIISVLRRFKVPEIFLELMNLIYRFLFILLETGSQIRVSQLSRLGYSSFRRSIFSLSQLVSNLFIRSYHRARWMLKALESRGYEGEIKVLEVEYEHSLKNIGIMALVEVLLIITVL